MVSTQNYSPGLEGVIAGESRVSQVNPELDSLIYRGYDIRDLAENATFEEVAYLLLYGELPTRSQLDEFKQKLYTQRDLPEQVIQTLKSLPKNSNYMDTLRTGVSMLAHFDPQVDDNSHDANMEKAIRLTAKMPTIVCAAYRIFNGQEPVKPDTALSHSENFLFMLKGEKPDPNMSRYFDTALILYAEHGFNASTFAGRVIASTLSDLHSSIVGAIGALKGSLHGGANEKAMEMLIEIGSPDKAEQYVMNALAQKKKLMGFGHRVYKKGDTRAPILKAMGERLSQQLGNTTWHEIANIVEQTVMREKGIIPNVDFPASYLFYLMGLPIPLYTPIFAISRISGWSAHVIEQLDNNRLIRPKSEYIGEKHRKFVPLEQR